MQKILLILEDYSELMFVQIILKKLGFDVDGIQNPHAIQDRLMAFRPQMVIAPEEGKRVKKEMIAQALNNLTPNIKAILLSPSAHGIEHVRAGVCRIQSPIQPLDMIRALGQLLNTDAEVLISKYQKFRKQLGGSAENIREAKDIDPTVLEALARTEGVSSVESQDIAREERYRNFLANAGDKVEAQFTAKDVQLVHRKLRTISESPSDVDIQRQAFTNRMFKKKG